MTTHQVFGFLVFAFVAAVTPGPSNLILAAIGANRGIKNGMPSLLGVSAGMGLMMFLVPLGVGGVVLRVPLVRAALHWGGAVFLLVMSWQIAASGGTTSRPDRGPAGFLGMATFQWMNPKSWLVAVGAAGAFLSTGDRNPVIAAAAFAGLFTLAAVPCCFVWLAAGSSLQRVLRHRRGVRIFNITMGLLLALSVVLILQR